MHSHGPGSDSSGLAPHGCTVGFWPNNCLSDQINQCFAALLILPSRWSLLAPWPGCRCTFGSQLCVMQHLVQLLHASLIPGVRTSVKTLSDQAHQHCGHIRFQPGKVASARLRLSRGVVQPLANPQDHDLLCNMWSMKLGIGRELWLIVLSLFAVVVGGGVYTHTQPNRKTNFYPDRHTSKRTHRQKNNQTKMFV